MKDSVTVERIPQLATALRRYGDKALQAAARSLQRQGIELLNGSNALVPVMDGHLRDSGHVTPAIIEGESIYVLVGYGGVAAAYARAVHDNPRAGKTGGVSPSGVKYKKWAQVGQWRFLEIPFKAMRGGIGKRLAADVASETSR